MSDAIQSSRERLQAFRKGFKAGAGANARDERFSEWPDYARGYKDGTRARMESAEKWMRENGITHAMAASWVLR